MAKDTLKEERDAPKRRKKEIDDALTRARQRGVEPAAALLAWTRIEVYEKGENTLKAAAEYRDSVAFRLSCFYDFFEECFRPRGDSSYHFEDRIFDQLKYHLNAIEGLAYTGRLKCDPSAQRQKMLECYSLLDLSPPDDLRLPFKSKLHLVRDGINHG